LLFWAIPFVTNRSMSVDSSTRGWIQQLLNRRLHRIAVSMTLFGMIATLLLLFDYATSKDPTAKQVFGVCLAAILGFSFLSIAAVLGVGRALLYLIVNSELDEETTRMIEAEFRTMESKDRYPNRPDV
jgi:hypothetical protein